MTPSIHSILRHGIKRLRSSLESRRLRRREIERELDRIRQDRELQWAEAQRQRDFLYALGNSFEDTVIGMFDPSAFELIHRTPTDKDTHGRFVPSMALPDLRFRERSTGRRFWVECKYRARVAEDWSLEWCTEHQLREYHDAGRCTGEPVFVVIGIGGTVQRPELVYCLDVGPIHYTTLFYGTYKGHRVRGTVRSLDEIREIAGRRAP